MGTYIKRHINWKESDEMIRVLVTGVGAIIGYGVIKSLRKLDEPVYIVGMDIYDDAVGQHWCDKFIQAKYAVDPQYMEFLKKVIHENEIDLVFFGTEQEIYRVNNAREELGGEIDKFVINKPNVLELSKDKWLTREFLIGQGLSDLTIPSVIEGTYEEIAQKFGERFMLKPRSSYASKGIEIVSNKEEFDFYKKRMGSNFMAQKLVGDAEHEYTVSIFGKGDGTYFGRIALRRVLSQEGATAKAEVVEYEKLFEEVDLLCQAFKPFGPTNLQFRLEEGKYLLLEINPRISSSTSIRMAFGFNEAQMCLEYYLKGNIIVPEVRKGKAVRFIDEVVSVL